jgi:Co/Zn/Cd efflux system component
LFTFLVTLTVWRSVRFYEQPSVRNGATFGISTGLAALTKAVILLYPVLFLALWAWQRRQKDDSQPSPGSIWTAVTATVGLMALTISPWTIRNYSVTGHFVPITTGLSDAFLRGYIFSKPQYALLQRPPYTDGENESNAWFKEICARQGAVWEANDLETDRLLNQAAKEKLVSDPVAFVKKFSTGIFTFWYQMTSKTNSIIAGVPAALAWLFAIAGWRRARAENRPAWIIFLPILYLNILLAALLALGRYSVPILPTLIVMSAFGIETLWPQTVGAKPVDEQPPELQS